jgi:hypothetical protein
MRCLSRTDICRSRAMTHLDHPRGGLVWFLLILGFAVALWGGLAGRCARGVVSAAAGSGAGAGDGMESNRAGH